MELELKCSRITLDPDNVRITGDRSLSPRGLLLLRLVTPLAPLLPRSSDGSPISIQVSDHDLGSWIPGADQMKAIGKAIKQGRYMTEEELAPYEKQEGRGPVKGLFSACPVDSPGWQAGLKRGISEFVPIPEKRMFLHQSLLDDDGWRTSKE